MMLQSDQLPAEASRVSRRRFVGLGVAAVAGSAMRAASPGETYLHFWDTSGTFRFAPAFQAELRSMRQLLEAYGLPVSVSSFADDHAIAAVWGCIWPHFTIASHSLPVAFADALRAWYGARPGRAVTMIRDGSEFWADTPAKMETLCRLL